MALFFQPPPFPHVLTEIGLAAICTSVWKQAKCQPSHGFHTEESSGRPLDSHPDCRGSGLAVLMNVLTLGSHELGKHFCHRLHKVTFSISNFPYAMEKCLFSLYKEHSPPYMHGQVRGEYLQQTFKMARAKHVLLGSKGNKRTERGERGQ